MTLRTDATVIFLTGMSGCGKSSLLAELTQRGFCCQETDVGDWCIDRSEGKATMSDWVWNEAKLSAWLAELPPGVVFLSGCVSNQARFYACFAAIVVLKASEPTLMQRLRQRRDNPYGKTEQQRAEVAHNLRTVQPLLERRADLVLDAERPLRDLADDLEALSLALLQHSHDRP